jgi:hypothetical protein
LSEIDQEKCVFDLFLATPSLFMSKILLFFLAQKIMSEVELETKFEKIRLEEVSSSSKEEAKCECKQTVTKVTLEHSTNTGNNLKVKDKRRNLIKPSRLKMIGSCWARKSRNGEKDEAATNETQAPAADDLDTFTSEAFLKLRIKPNEVLIQQPQASTSSPAEEKDERVSPASQSCSAQAKLQQQFSSSEFDSTIEEMSEVLAYHLNLYPPDKNNFLVDSMYT